jgi:hypothetical protein
VRSLVAVVATLGLLVACSPAPPAPPTAPPPTVTPVPVPTTPPTPIAAAVDYKALRQPLLIPLGALIVAVRARTPTTTYWLDQFNKAADQVLPAIDGDTSPNATRLRTSIMNVRAMPDNLDALEKSRSDLLEI